MPAARLRARLRSELGGPLHGYEATREAAMAAFAKSWRRWGVDSSIAIVRQSLADVRITEAHLRFVLGCVLINQNARVERPVMLQERR